MRTVGEGVWLSSLPVFFSYNNFAAFAQGFPDLALCPTLLSQSHSVAQAGWSRTHGVVQCDLEFKAFLRLRLPRSAGISGVAHQLEKDLAA